MISLLGPTGQELGATEAYGPNAFLDATRLPRSGHYTVLVDPRYLATG